MKEKTEDSALKQELDDVEIGQETELDNLFDKGSKGIEPTQILYILLAVIASSFALYTAVFGILESWAFRMIHLLLILSLLYVGQLRKGDKKISIFSRAVNVLMLLGIVAVALYAYIEYDNIFLRMGRPNGYDQIFSFILIVVVLVATYKKMGKAITALAVLFLVYTLFGNYFPGELYHRGASYGMLTDYMFNSTRGILGIPLKVAAEYVIMFIIFGAFLSRSGAGEFFVKLAFALTGKMWGGPAKAAVVASAMMATINGSGVGNAVATGSVTIPLMKKVGYKPHFAAAVEAAASTGGMIMPPLMASVAFLIAEFTRTPYSQIMLHGLIPATLYFVAVMVMVHFEAKKTDLCPLEASAIPKIGKVMKEGGYFLLPIIALVYLLFSGSSPMRAAAAGIGIMVILSQFKKETRMGPKEILSALEEGATNTAVVTVACAVAGIIVGSISVSGLGIRFSSMILALAGDSLPLVLILTMISSILLGLGMTAAAVYIIVTSLTVTALGDMGIGIIPANFFVYYFGLLSALTPPVALAAYGAAGIAGADHNKTAFSAMRLAVVAYVVPFAFIYNPALLAIGSLTDILLSSFFALFGVIAISAGLSNFLFVKTSKIERLLLVVSGVLLLSANFLINAGGLVILVLVFIKQRRLADPSEIPHKEECTPVALADSQGS